MHGHIEAELAYMFSCIDARSVPKCLIPTKVWARVLYLCAHGSGAMLCETNVFAALFADDPLDIKPESPNTTDYKEESFATVATSSSTSAGTIFHSFL